NCLHQLWSALSTTEKDWLEQITRKLLSRLDQMEQGGVVLEAMS
ncbi:transcriptional repressor MprA, partial [Escherichia coli]|nr:transcriptional repressor MprA [Escherichia coli]